MEFKYSTFDLLTPYPQVSHGTFLKHGGFSKAPFASLNVSISSGDCPENVMKNREIICKALDLPKIVYAKVNHGINIEWVTDEKCNFVPECDALFTKEKNIGLAITHADCQAAIFYDQVNEIIGIVHAGWRGLVQNIYAKAVENMGQQGGSKAADLIVCIAPSIGPDRAEYKNYKTDFPRELWEFQVKPNYFDFWKLGKKQLLDCGVMEKNIEICKICTHCNKRDYFSYRRDKKTGRHATVVALKSH